MRLARESAIHDHLEENADLDSLLADVDDDKTFAAMGVAKTISTVSHFLSLSFHECKAEILLTSPDHLFHR